MRGNLFGAATTSGSDRILPRRGAGTADTPRAVQPVSAAGRFCSRTWPRATTRSVASVIVTSQSC